MALPRDGKDCDGEPCICKGAQRFEDLKAQSSTSWYDVVRPQCGRPLTEKMLQIHVIMVSSSLRRSFPKFPRAKATRGRAPQSVVPIAGGIPIMTDSADPSSKFVVPPTLSFRNPQMSRWCVSWV